MSYLEIIEKVKRERQSGSQPLSKPEPPYEINEFNEISPLRAAESAESEPEPLGAERGYLILDDMPELERRLRLSGWKTERRGNELICWTPGRRKPRIQ